MSGMVRAIPRARGAETTAQSGRLQVARRLFAAALVGDELVGDLLTFGERTHAGLFNSGDVDENVLAALIRLNEIRSPSGR